MHGTCSTWRGFIARGVGATSDRINAQLLILLLVYRGYFLCDVGIAWLTLYAVISSVIVPHSGGLHPKLFLVEGSSAGSCLLSDMSALFLCAKSALTTCHKLPPATGGTRFFHQPVELGRQVRDGVREPIHPISASDERSNPFGKLATSQFRRQWITLKLSGGEWRQSEG